ncbi:hypothetical protein VHEMI10259 [[Torrubiella] hemipterigena]|uniref:Uncharacterized protein n=1 Tax=[Torrubiella] hemipterigena TaxID=1531966 RepID=A0A0A1TRW0_9HYPO|nr:hypothetical protein VHEMI10259 [[Torrubiella] hemipterigena]
MYKFPYLLRCIHRSFYFRKDEVASPPAKNNQPLDDQTQDNSNQPAIAMTRIDNSTQHVDSKQENDNLDLGQKPPTIIPSKTPSRRVQIETPTELQVASSSKTQIRGSHGVIGRDVGSKDTMTLETSTSNQEVSPPTLVASATTPSSVTIPVKIHNRESRTMENPATSHNTPPAAQYHIMGQSDDGQFYESYKTENQLIPFSKPSKDQIVVIFLPRVTAVAENDSLRTMLEKHFLIDSFFLTKRAYKANGLFRGLETSNSVILSSCRFLVKEVSDMMESADMKRIRDQIQTASQGKSIVKEDEHDIKSEITAKPERSNADILATITSKYPMWKIREYILSTQYSETTGYKSVIYEQLHGKRESENPLWHANAERTEAQLLTDYRNIPELANKSGLKAEIEEATRIATDFTVFLTNLATPRSPAGIIQLFEPVPWVDHRCLLPPGLQAMIAAENDAKKKQKKKDDSGDLWLLLDEMVLNAFHNVNCFLHEPEQRQTDKDVSQKPRKPVMSMNRGTSLSVGEAAEKHPTIPPYYAGSSTHIKHMYHWFYFYFWAMEFQKNNAQVLLCFDDGNSPKIKFLIEHILRDAAGKSQRPRIWDLVLEQVAGIYDTALWGFRSPVRNIERRRQEHALKVPSGSYNAMDKKAAEHLKLYFDMHELSRHLIHSQETLAAAEATFAAIMNRQRLNSQSGDAAEFCLTFVKNLRLRAVAFVDRLNNEISLAYHINNAKQLQHVQGLLYESRNDGRYISKFVGIVSVVFLPGTFFSGLFSMTFFSFDTENGAWRVNDLWWVWAVASLPLTAVGICYIYWKYAKSQRMLA